MPLSKTMGEYPPADPKLLAVAEAAEAKRLADRAEIEAIADAHRSGVPLRSIAAAAERNLETVRQMIHREVGRLLSK